MAEIALASDVAVLALDEAAGPALARRSPVRLVTADNVILASEAPRLFILTTAEQLESDRVAELVREVSRAGKLEALLIRQPTDQWWVRDVLDTAGIRPGRKAQAYSEPAVAQRIITARVARASRSLIADARAVGGYLLVKSCDLRTIRVPFRDDPLSAIGSEDRGDFEIDEDGDSILWPKSGVQVDLLGLRRIIDPALRERAIHEGHSYDVSYGSGIRRLRVETGLRQTDIPGLSAKQVSRIELGNQRPTASAIRLLAAAHRLAPNDYMGRVASLKQDETSSAARSRATRSRRAAAPTPAQHAA